MKMEFDDQTFRTGPRRIDYGDEDDATLPPGTTVVSMRHGSFAKPAGFQWVDA